MQDASAPPMYANANHGHKVDGNTHGMQNTGYQKSQDDVSSWPASAAMPPTYNAAAYIPDKQPNGFGQQNVVIVQMDQQQMNAPRSNSPQVHLYPKGPSVAIGSVQLISGVAAIILSVFSIFALPFAFGIAMGVWAITAGSIGIAAGVQKKGNLVVATMVVSIVAASIAWYVIVFGGIFSAFRIYSPDLKYYTDYINTASILLAIVGLIEGVTAILASALSCRFAACCCGSCRRCCCNQYDNGEI